MFITNEKGKNLKERLKELIEHSEELKFLVGFFYFSGVAELYETLKERCERGELKKGAIKVLVGLETDRDIYGLYEKVARRKNSLDIEKSLREHFKLSLEKAFTSEELDRKEVYEQYEFFLKLFEEGILELKKTRDPNHAKLYLFKLKENPFLPHLFITGSSNLTRAGLSAQDEFNVEIKDYGFEEAEEYFDRLWSKAVEISPEDVRQVFEEKTIFRPIEPFKAYAYLLWLYLQLNRVERGREELLKSIMKDKGYEPYDYQISAVEQAIEKLEDHGGVILADVVGLGKTVIACLIARLLNEKGIVICPPHLVGERQGEGSGWYGYLKDFELHSWEVFSVGKLEEALEHTKTNQIGVVIIDEAHRFRNEATKSYHLLREICRGKKVILLSATPFNNRPSDIFALLKLFTIPDRSSLVLDGRLEQRFRRYEDEFSKLTYIRNYLNSPIKDRRERAKKYYREVFESQDYDIKRVEKRLSNIARDIRETIAKVVIRRNRLDLRYYKDAHKISLPEVKDPVEVFFELTEEQSKYYDKVLQSFLEPEEGGRFRGAVYMPFKYEKEVEDFEKLFQENLYNLIRRFLVKRFESSFRAFSKSLDNFIELHNKVIEVVRRRGFYVLDREFLDELLEADEDEIQQKIEEYKKILEVSVERKRYEKLYEVSKMRGFLEDVERDRRLFEELKEELQKLKLEEKDPKFLALTEKLKELMREGRKVVIFTEFADTARYLEERLKEVFGDIVLGAYGSISKSRLEEIKNSFGPKAKTESRHMILVATDKLSEGIDLNRAGAVFNYDIPWNPVRVIQRVGRINRIGKKFYDELYIFNFFPTEKGAQEVKAKEIAQNKLFMIHRILGEDAKIFSPEEEPTPSELYKRLTQYREEEEESFYTKVYKEFESIKERFENIEEEFKKLPPRIKTAKRGEKDELLVFIKKRRDLFVVYKDYESKRAVPVEFGEEVLEKIRCQPEEKRLKPSDKFWENYQQVFKEEFYGFPSSLTGKRSKVRNLLQSLLKEEELKDMHEAIKALIRDVSDYGTLSEYFLDRLLELEGLEASLKRQRLKELLKDLGGDLTVKDEEMEEKEVIIAIENQHGG